MTVTADIRMDRYCAPIYRALAETVRDYIEARIPKGGYLSLTHGGRDFTGRIYVGTVCIATSLPCRYLEVAAWQALRRAEAVA